MPRRSRPRNDPRSNLVANSEQRPGKVLSAFRKLDSDSSSLIGGIVGELASSGDIPELKSIPYGHRAFVFDPKLLDRRFNRGFIAGAKLVELNCRVKETYVDLDDTIEASIGRVILLPDRRRTLLAEVVSPRLIAERKNFYAALAHVGIVGFTADGAEVAVDQWVILQLA
jgi:hypothetical protein